MRSLRLAGLLRMGAGAPLLRSGATGTLHTRKRCRGRARAMGPLIVRLNSSHMRLV